MDQQTQSNLSQVHERTVALEFAIRTHKDLPPDADKVIATATLYVGFLAGKSAGAGRPGY